MEGPTPVSALIHAATMVTAGVYMVTRCTPLFLASVDAQHVVAIVGAITVALGGVIAITQTDLKRVLAYSTISQLGYMFLGLGVGSMAGITAGMFHLITHAFFKALLFLAAGSVMHAMGGVIDMRRFGGLRRIMPITHWTFLFGCSGPGGRGAVCGLLEQGRDPWRRPREGARRAAVCLAVLGRHAHGLPDRDLYVSRVLSHVLRTAARAARSGAPCPRVAARDDRAAARSGRVRLRCRHVPGRARPVRRVAGADALAGLLGGSPRGRTCGGWPHDGVDHQHGVRAGRSGAGRVSVPGR